MCNLAASLAKMDETKSYLWHLLVLFMLTCSGAGSESVFGSGVLNKRVERTVDIASQVVKISTKITLENAGKTPVTSFFFAVSADDKDHLAYIEATSQEDGQPNLNVIPTAVAEHRDKLFWRIPLRNSLEPGRFAQVEVETTFTNMLVPYPFHITQSERQLVRYRGNHYFFSPYPTQTQTTTVILSSSAIESYSKLKPVSQSDATISYGPYEAVPPFSVNEMTVHYENNSPFLSVTKLERTMEVSHWGMLSVEEVVDLKHVGAILKGPFSRYEYQRDQAGMASVKAFKTILPASAVDVYYRDEIGNISTSHLRSLHDSVEVELRPRFPLFGGWKTHYVLGYYVPTYEYLFHSGDQYLLKMRFVDHIFDDAVIEEAIIKVILPEGAKDIKLKLPFDVTRQRDQLHFTYLDTVGRPVVVLHKTNLAEQHIQDFEVYYRFQKVMMLQEPLLVVLALYLLFVLVIIYVRLDFTITKDPHHELKLQVSGIVERVQAHHDRRADIYAQYDAAINKLKMSKDSVAYQATLKKLHTDHKNATQAITELLTKLKTDGMDAADKVTELQRMDRTMKDYFQQHTVLVEKLVATKMNKQQFVEAEATLTKKKEELAEKMQTIVSSL